MTIKTTKQLIGRRTNIDLVRYNMTGLVAKIDTGAFHNAVHCNRVEVVKTGLNRHLSFHLLDIDHPQYVNKEIRVRNFTTVRVTNSFGQTQKRYMIKLRIRLTGTTKTYVEDFTLVDRSNMRAPILLGREFLRGRFMVDVAKFKIQST